MKYRYMNKDKLVQQSNKGTHNLILVIKSWQKNIPIDWRNIIIAEALNYCVYKKYFVVENQYC